MGGNILKQLRLSGNITQAQLARELHVSQTAINKWEKGLSFPDFKNQRALADFYGISIDELFGRRPDTKTKGVKIPVLGRVQAGMPVEAIEDIYDYEDITPEMAEHGEFFALKVRGDSMSPRMLEGDIVIVRKQSDCDNGDIAIVLVNGYDATIKKIKKSENGIALIPLNTAYDPLFYTNEEILLKPVTIIGKVVEQRRKY